MVRETTAELLSRLAPDQRVAASASSGPVLCVAPAGSGKTTTLVARIGWLIDRGTPAANICAITFNKRAAEELERRLGEALRGSRGGAPSTTLGGPLDATLRQAPVERGRDPTGVRVRTFHALGREILLDGGATVEPLLDRMAILRRVFPDAGSAGWRRLDDAFSRLKLDVGATADEVATDPEPGPIAQAFLRYEAALDDDGGLDFDDLVGRALRLLEDCPPLLARWRARCAELLVDEVQDVDRSQLRLALLLAAPANRIFLVGDDDQSIYGWRLADVRRLLSLADESLPGLLRVDLETNYRCPAPVLERAVRLIEHNEERFRKAIRARAGAVGRLVLAPSAADDVDRAAAVLRSWPDDKGTRAVLARTNRELQPVAVAALRLCIPFRAPGLRMPVESPLVDELLAAARAASRDPSRPTLLALAGLPERDPAPMEGDGRPDADQSDPDSNEQELDRRATAAALIGWAAGCATLDELGHRIATARQRLAELRRDDAPLILATAHGTKGLEFDHVAVMGLDEGRFPSARSVAEAVEPERALEEERRLAYVAWTRARRSLTLIYDPGAPSSFLFEAFGAAELGASAAPS